jgi:flagellar assembly protein FliH
MATPLARRPRFLAEVPETPSTEPVLFTVGAMPSHAPHPRAHAADRHREQRSPPLPAPSTAAESHDLAALRREAMEKVSAALETLRAHAERLAEQARSDAIEIGFQVARKILETELRQNPEALFALVRAALRRAGESRRIAVRVAPEDASLLQSDAGRAALDGITSARIELVTDPGLQRGDCMVDTDFGQVDGRLGTRLGEIRRAVDAAGEGAA